MAISTSFESVLKKYNPKYWKSIDEFEQYYLQEIAENSEINFYTDRNGVELKISDINHHPELKEYEVWMEGYAATGERGTAQLLGKVKARNFGQACHIVMCKNHLEWMKKENQPDYKQYSTPSRWDYDPNKLTYWGCKLYWSEELAKKYFG